MKRKVADHILQEQAIQWLREADQDTLMDGLSSMSSQSMQKLVMASTNMLVERARPMKKIRTKASSIENDSGNYDSRKFSFQFWLFPDHIMFMIIGMLCGCNPLRTVVPFLSANRKLYNYRYLEKYDKVWFNYLGRAAPMSMIRYWSTSWNMSIRLNEDAVRETNRKYRKDLHKGGKRPFWRINGFLLFLYGLFRRDIYYSVEWYLKDSRTLRFKKRELSTFNSFFKKLTGVNRILEGFAVDIALPYISLSPVFMKRCMKYIANYPPAKSKISKTLDCRIELKIPKLVKRPGLSLYIATMELRKGDVSQEAKIPEAGECLLQESEDQIALFFKDRKVLHQGPYIESMSLAEWPTLGLVYRSIHEVLPFCGKESIVSLTDMCYRIETSRNGTNSTTGLWNSDNYVHEKNTKPPLLCMPISKVELRLNIMAWGLFLRMHARKKEIFWESLTEYSGLIKYQKGIEKSSILAKKDQERSKNSE